MSLQGSLSIERMCELTRVSRASFYRSFREQRPVEEEMEVRSAIQQIAVEHRRRYGYRRIAAELRRRGMPVNHKRVMRIMAEDNLLAVRIRGICGDHEQSSRIRGPFEPGWPHETDWDQSAMGSGHHLHSIEVGICVPGGDSRRVFSESGGLGVGQTLAVRLALTALNKALVERNPGPGLVHHSDRGLQYASSEYVNVLREHQMIPEHESAGESI